MTTTTFIDKQTVIEAPWLNDVNGHTYSSTPISPATTVHPSGVIQYTPSGTGAVATTVQSKLSESVSIADFGGVGNGVANDSQAFIYAAATGKPIDLVGKTWYINTNTSIALIAPLFNGTIVVGAAILDKAVTLNGDGTFVKDVNFVGGASVVAKALTVLSTCYRFSITNCRFYAFKNGGIQCQSGSLNGTILGNSLDSCAATADGLQYGAIVSNTNVCNIVGNHLANCSQTGISVFGVHDVLISNNYIEGNGISTVSGGIISDGLTTDLIISNNVIKGVSVEGIQVSGSVGGYGGATTRIIISDNVITEAAYSGITVYSVDTGGVQLVSVTGNIVSKAATTQWAIQLDKVLYATVSGNSLKGYASGIKQDNSCSFSAVSGNFIQGFSSVGVFAWAAHGSVINNNILGIVGTATGISANSSTIAGNVLIAGNNITTCLVGINAVFTALNSIAVQGNYLVGNTTDFSYTGQNPNSSSDNIIGDKVNYGAFTLAGGFAIVANSTVRTGDKINLYFVDSGTGSYLTTGAHQVVRIDSGTQFLVSSTNASDTSNIAYEIVR